MIKRVPNNRCFIVVKNRFLASLLFKKAFGLGLILLLTFLPLLNVEAAPNYQINYQGKLHDSAGDPVADGDYDIVFNLYTASSGGSPIWTESHTGANDVTTADGLFSVMLGSITSIASVNFNQTLYLGVTVEADSEMTPRKVLGTVPSAFEADKLDGLTSADFISTSTTALPNVWSASGLGSVGSSTATTTFLGNLAAAGSSIFNGILTVFDRVTSPYFVATSTSVASVFPYASTTMITSTTASTTNLIISGLGSGLTKVTNGVVSLATAGTDYLTSAFQNWQISGGYLTPTTTQVVKVDGLISTASSTISGLLTTNYASTTALTISGSGHSFNITNSSATSTILGDVNIAGSTGVTIWTNDGNSNVAQGSLNIGSATPQNGFAVTRLGGSDTTFARFTEAGGALAQFVDGTGIQLDFRDTSVVSRIRFDTNGDNYITPATGNVYFSPAAGNVGVGTSSPLYPFSVQGASSGFIAGIRNTTAGGDLLTLIGDAGDSVFDFVSGGTGGEAVLRMYSDGSLVNQISARSAETTYFNGGNVGIGTTTPGTLLSLGNTGASTINITPTGTSTFGLGIDLRGGCYAINGTCIGGGSASLSGGTAGMLAAWTSSSALTATSSPTALSFTATSTSVASVFPYASTTALTVSGAGNSFIVSQGNVGIGTTTPQAILSSEVSSNAFGLLLTQSGATKRRKIGFGLDTDVTQWQLGTDFNSDSGDNFWLWARGGGFIQTWLDNGNVGIGTTSPYARLSVAGETVAQNFTATSTSLASTFPYASTTALSVSGTSYLGSLIQSGSTLGNSADTDLLTFGTNDLLLTASNADWDQFRISSASTQAGIGLYTSGDDWQLYNNSGTLTFREATGAKAPLTINPTSGQTTLLYSSTTAATITGAGAAFIVSQGSAGIGTSSPQAKLAIGAGNILLDNNQYLSAYKNAGAVVNILGINTSSQTVLTSGSGNNIIFNPSGSTAMTLSSGGLLGIGTTSPDYLLTLGNTASAGNNKIAIDAAANRQSSIAFRSAGVNKWHLGRGDSDVLSDSTFFIGTDSANANDPGGNGARFVINSTGLIGMGTVAPDENLHISGNSTTEDTVLVLGNQAFTGGMLTTLKWQADTDGASERDTAAIKAEQTGATTGKLRFFTDNGGIKEGAVLTDLAFWGIGTTTPGAQLAASSSATAIGLMIDQRGTGDIARFLDAGTPVLTIRDGGLVGIGTSTSATTEGLLHVAENSTGAVNSVVSNTNSGTGAFATFQLRNGGSLSESLRLGVLGTGFTTSGGFIQDAGFLAAETNLSGGLTIMTRAAAPIRFYTNGSTNERMQISSGGDVGIGTSTPGSLFSLGDTGASTINITPTGTSTFGLGLNLRGGCYAINNTCIGGSGGSGTVNSGTADYVAYYPSNGTAVSTASGIKTYAFSSTFRGTAVGDPTYALAGSTLVPQGIFEVGYFSTSTFPTYAGWHDALSINGYSNSGDANSRWVDFVAGGANSAGFGHSTMRFYTRGNESNPSLALTIEPDKDVVIVGDLTVSGNNLNTTVSNEGLTLNSNLTINGGRINNSTTTIISSGIDDGGGNDGGTVIISKGGTGEDPDEGNGGTVDIASGGIGISSGDSGGDGGTITMVAGGLEGGGAGTDGNDGTVNIGNSASTKKNATLNVYGTVGLMFRNTATTNGVCHSGTDLDTTDTTTSYNLVACSAAPGDVAEMYSTENDVEAGDIVAVGNETITYEASGGDPYTGQVHSLGMVTVNKMRKAEAGDVGVAGVISTAPFQTFGKDVLKKDPKAKPLALAGRVPVKVNMEGGEIKAGDKITLSSVAGVGKKASGGGVTVGVALQDYDGPGEGKILVLVNLDQSQIDEGIVGGGMATSTMWTLNSSGHMRPFATLDMNNMDITNVRSITSASGNWSIGEDGTLTAKKIQTEELCVGNVCIDQDDLRDILRSADINFLDHINNDDDNSTTTDDTATSTDDTATTTDETDIEEGDGSASSTPPVEPDPEPELETPTGDEIPTDNGGTEPEPPAETPPAE